MPDELSHAAYEETTPLLLASQSVTTEPRELPASLKWQTAFTHLESQLGALRVWRYSWWSHWARLAEFFLPRRFHWLVVANRTTRGSPINDSIIDSTGPLAVNICASGLWTGLTSPSRPWFKIGVAQTWVTLDKDSQAWLEDTEKRLYAVLAQSNFYATMAQAFQDVVVFGTAPVIMYEDEETVLRCYLPCAGEYFLSCGPRLTVEILNREFTLTVLQIVGWFKIENCPSQVVEHWNRGGASLQIEFVVCHCIEPNTELQAPDRERSSFSVVPAKFAYRETYWLKGMQTPKPLSQRGFNKKPFMAARWSTVSNDAYGRSPCMDALGDNRQIQMETRRKAEFIEKLVRPPMGADVAMKNEPTSILPGNVTFTSTENNKKGFWPLFEVAPAALQPLVEDIKVTAQRINEALFVPVFMAISRMEGVQPRNELELTKRDLERLQVLGPFIDMFETEFAGPAIERTLDIMFRRRLLRPIPPGLAGLSLKFDYISIMKMAQQSARAVGMKDFFATMGGLSSAAKAAGVPDPLRVVNLEGSARAFAEVTDFPLHLLFTEQEVQQHDQIRMQEQQKAQAPQQAMAAVNAAKTLSETQIPGGNSALGALLGQGGGA